MNTLIIEDEKPASDRLKRLLKEINPDIYVLATLESVRASKQWLLNNQADLIFLDIYLSDGLSFSIFDDLYRENGLNIATPIIFTTAYDQYAIRAFKLNSLDYLLKPISKEELSKSLKKYDDLHQKISREEIDFSSLIASLKGPEYQARFMVSYGQKIQTIPTEEIAYFYAADKMVYLVHQDGTRYIIDYTLDHLDDLLNPEAFFRINRKFIISYQSIHEMYSYPKGRVKIILKPKCSLESIVSLERASDFKAWLNR